MGDPTPTAYDEAVAAIAAGTAKGHALWVLLTTEGEREGYALKPMPWEGSGQYQHVTFDDGRSGFVRIPGDRKSLPTDWGKRKAKAAQVVRTADLGAGWFASANDDGSFTLRNGDKGQRIDLTSGEAARFCILYDEAAGEAAERKSRDEEA